MNNVNSDFIHQLEGISLSGYVPDPESSQSGVTIASGFDIGQCSATELSKLFPEALANKLTPYCNKQKMVAVNFLKQHPLQISARQAIEINTVIFEKALHKITQQWNAKCPSIPFSKLPEPCATVVASVAFQYGNLATRTPNFWQQVTSLHWQDALNNLKNFGDKYPTRRHQEAALLESWLTTQTSTQGK